MVLAIFGGRRIPLIFLRSRRFVRSVYDRNKIHKIVITDMEKNDVPLTPEIEELHRIACEKGETSYIDPVTGYTVFTGLFHKKRGKCCGNKCRHCPFGHVNVRYDKK